MKNISKQIELFARRTVLTKAFHPRCHISRVDDLFPERSAGKLILLSRVVLAMGGVHVTL